MAKQLLFGEVDLPSAACLKQKLFAGDSFGMKADVNTNQRI